MHPPLDIKVRHLMIMCVCVCVSYRMNVYKVEKKERTYRRTERTGNTRCGSHCHETTFLSIISEIFSSNNGELVFASITLERLTLTETSTHNRTTMNQRSELSSW